ncbi:MAG TPA: ABC transporter permease [Capillimicrobium sp.]|jgi:peptide/nickel transport system permease protein
MASTDSAAPDFSTDVPAAIAAEKGIAAGTGPWRIAWRRLRRNKVALAFGVLFLLLVAFSFSAPLWAEHVAGGVGPNTSKLSGQIEVDGKMEYIVALDGVPIGPTWQGEYFLGADRIGRDVMVRLLYGGRNSLMIGFGASLITMVLATVLGLLAGFFRGWIDTIISRVFDVMWAFPVVLLGIALGVSLNLGGLSLGPLQLEGGSLWIPTIIIGVAYVVYLARPIRGQVLALREKEFIEAARAQGMGSWRIMFTELLPNLASTLLVFFPIIVANAILLEAALSFLGAGVQPPQPSWGTMISQGVEQLVTAPHLTIAPGLMLVLTVLSLNIFGEGVRDALDPRSKIRVEG